MECAAFKRSFFPLIKSQKFLFSTLLYFIALRCSNFSLSVIETSLLANINFTLIHVKASIIIKGNNTKYIKITKTDP